MESSDSEEDFESADEYCDHKEKFKQKTEENLNITIIGNKPIELAQSERIVAGITQCLDELAVKNESTQKIEGNDLVELMDKLNERKETLADVPQCLDESNLRNESPLKNENNDSAQLLEKDEEKIKVDTSCDTSKVKLFKKLGVKLKKEEGSSSSLKCLGPRSQSNNSSKENEISQITVEKIYQVQPSEKCVLVTQPGDGWDIDEDFETPTALSKPDDTIFCKVTQSSGLAEECQKEDKAWGWGGWGMPSLLTDSVSVFSSQVTAGLSSVIENTVGAPSPEALAATNIENPVNDENYSSESFRGFSSFVSGVSLLSNTVINRGLDTLETLGKKTMEVLQEGDPGLMKKRAMFFPNQDKPVLSQILKEAKEKADHSDKEKEEKEMARKAHFESLFDDFQGLVHLEALEMLSKQCELKLQTMLSAESGPALEDLQETLSQVQELCELPDEEEELPVLSLEEFINQVTSCMKGLHINISATKIVQVNDKVTKRLEQLDSETATVVHQTAISCLAEFTASTMECFHKSAELLLAKPIHNTADEAENFALLTGHLCGRVTSIANEFTQLLTKNHPIANSSSITNIFLEASNSCLYMRNACQLLVPILQVGAVSS